MCNHVPPIIDSEKLLTHFVHLNCLAPLWIISCVLSNLESIIFCQALCTWKSSCLCGSSNVFKSNLLKRIYFHILCTSMASHLCRSTHVFSSNPIKRIYFHILCTGIACHMCVIISCVFKEPNKENLLTHFVFLNEFSPPG